MATVHRFEDLEVWKSARALTNAVYDATMQSKTFSRDFGLRDQIQRASVSVMSNIAEGFEGGTDAQFLRYLQMARASAGEVRSQLYVALDRAYIDSDQFNTLYDLADKTSRQLHNLMRHLKSRKTNGYVREDELGYDI
ncbi:MAG: four helix bundle protein [Rhodothermales bacterium]